MIVRRPLERQRDLIRIGAWCDEEIVFEPALVAVVREGDARIGVLVLHLGIGGNVCVPFRRIVADEVIHDAGERFHPVDGGRRIRPLQLHPHDGLVDRCLFRASRGSGPRERLVLRGCVPLLQDHHGFRRREKERVAVASREELDVGIDLAVIGLKL